MDTKSIKPYSRKKKEFFAHKVRSKSVVVDTIVVHYTAGGSLSGAISTLETRGLGYHYLIDFDGSVYKGAPYMSETYHAGSSYGPHEEAYGKSKTQYLYTKENVKAGRVHKFLIGCSVNPYTVGISLVNTNLGVPATPAQLKSLESLINDLKTVLPLKWVTGHHQVSPLRKSDPKGLDLDAVAKHTGLVYWKFPRS